MGVVVSVTTPEELSPPVDLDSPGCTFWCLGQPQFGTQLARLGILHWAGPRSFRPAARFRQVIWFGVTAHPTAEWIANQVTEACGWEQAPRYLIRDRDGAYGEVFIRRLRSIAIRDRPTSPRSPWQNGYAERLIGSIRRECLDHVIVLSERHLRHLLLCYMKFYNGARTHLSLEKDAPVSRAVDRAGHILCRPILGGLHHQYGRV